MLRLPFIYGQTLGSHQISNSHRNQASVLEAPSSSADNHDPEVQKISSFLHGIISGPQAHDQTTSFHCTGCRELPQSPGNPDGFEGRVCSARSPWGLAACRTVQSVTETDGDVVGQPFWEYFILLVLVSWQNLNFQPSCQKNTSIYLQDRANK